MIKWALLTAAAATGAFVGASAAQAAEPTPTIAYVRGGAIYVTSGGTETRLTEDQVNSRPRFAPDGRRIAYVHNNTVWVMNADGSGKRQVSDRAAGGPSWSPDGASIAFSALSGDHDGPPAARSLTWRLPEPSAFMTQTV